MLQQSVATADPSGDEVDPRRRRSERGAGRYGLNASETRAIDRENALRLLPKLKVA
ncbi:MAG: hypothetical protein JWO68_4084 [Actinomycetia bacterium]|nr:hypothetical protein [Actinomycetes bacterium]